MFDEPTEGEAIGSLARAAAKGADFITIFSKRQAWLWKAAEICVKLGYLEEGELVELDEQSSELRFRLTPAGKALKDTVRRTTMMDDEEYRSGRKVRDDR